MYVLRILTYTGTIILFINTVVYFTGFGQSSKASKYLAWYLLAISVIQSVTEIYAIKSINNHFLSTYYLFSQFILLSCFFYCLCISGDYKKIGTVIKYASILIISGLMAQYIIDPGLYFRLNSMGFLVTATALIVYSVLYLYRLMSESLPFNYTTIGIFIYLISTSVIFAAASSIVQFDSMVSMYLWKINAGMFIIYQLLIFYEWKQACHPQAMSRRR